MAHRKSPKKLEPIGNTLDKALRNHRMNIALESLRLRDLWLKAAGKTVFLHSRPVKIRDKTLYINVSDSGWSHTLALQKNDLIAKIKDMTGAPEIDAIKFRIGETPNDRGPEILDLKNVPLTSHEKRFIKETLSNFANDDDELRQVIEAVLTKGLIRRRLMKASKGSG